MTRAEIFANSRFAGQVERYHTWIVHRRQSNGEHMWQQMRIWYLIWGPMPPFVSTKILWSDAGELVTGDLPFPMKARNPDIKKLFDQKEREAVLAMGGDLPELDAHDEVRVKICDLVEMLEFGLVERNMGNMYAQPIIEDTLSAALAKLDLLPSELRLPAYAYLNKLGAIPIMGKL